MFAMDEVEGSEDSDGYIKITSNKQKQAIKKKVTIVEDMLGASDDEDEFKPKKINNPPPQAPIDSKPKFKRMFGDSDDSDKDTAKGS
jgi:hypothetical protein